MQGAGGAVDAKRGGEVTTEQIIERLEDPERYVDAIDAAIAALRRQTWRPTSEVPRGKLVLAYRPRLSGYDQIAIRRPAEWCGQKCCPNAEPTHFMPLPEVPHA